MFVGIGSSVSFVEAAVAPARKFKELETRVGYQFKSCDLLKKALTHASVRQASSKRRDNERLEFLGDRVLGLVIAELLCEKSTPPPTKATWQSSITGWCAAGPAQRSRANSTSGPSWCSAKPRRRAAGAKRRRSWPMPARPSSAHLSRSGLRTAQKVVRMLWGSRVGASSPADAADAKSLLQEWAQGQGLDLPAYVEIDRQGPDHAPRFTAEVRIRGRKPARGEGASKRAAEQAAATALLAREGMWKRGADA